MNNSPSNILQPLLLLKRYHQNGQAFLVATCVNYLMIRICKNICNIAGYYEWENQYKIIGIANANHIPYIYEQIQMKIIFFEFPCNQRNSGEQIVNRINISYIVKCLK